MSNFISIQWHCEVVLLMVVSDNCINVNVSVRIDIGGKVLTNHLKEVISYRSAHNIILFHLSFLDSVYCVSLVLV